MKIISVREMSPSAGKEALMEERIRRASGVMARHGAVSRIFKIGGGAGAGMVYMAGKASHKMSNEEMINHIVELVEKKVNI